MTYAEKEKLIKSDILSIENRVRHAFNRGYDLGYKEGIEKQVKTGHWIRVDKDKLRCSECDVIHFIGQYPQGKIAWCPNCGTKMVEPQESEET